MSIGKTGKCRRRRKSYDGQSEYGCCQVELD